MRCDSGKLGIETTSNWDEKGGSSVCFIGKGGRWARWGEWVGGVGRIIGLGGHRDVALVGCGGVS